MSAKALLEKGRLQPFLRALAVWWLAALPLCFLAACVLRAHAAGSESIAYASSALNFVCACLAGAAAFRGGGRLGSVLLCAGALCLMLLSTGVLAGSGEPEPSGVLSVLSFTVTGFLAGARLFTGRKETKRSQFQTRKKQRK